MQYLATIQRVKFDRNGNSRAVLTLYRYKDQTEHQADTEGPEYVPAARIVGYSNDVREALQALRSSLRCAVLALDEKPLPSVPRSDLPTLEAWRCGRGGIEYPHAVIAAAQNAQHDQKKAQA